MSDLNRSDPMWRDPATYPAPVATSGKAVASLVLGILGLFIPLVCSIIALFLGYSARKQIDAAGRLGGRGLAIAGIVLGWIGIAIVALVIALGGDVYFHVSVG